MKFTPICIALVVACTASASLLAAERTNPNLPSAPSVYEESPRKWMAGGNIGGGSFSMSGKLEREAESYRAAYGANDRTTAHVDGFFAWRIGGGKVFLGPTLDILVSNYDSTTNPDLNVTNFFVGGTMILFLGEHVRKGPFIRVDAGFVDSNLSSDKDKNAYPDQDFGGSGLHGGLGYAIPLGTKVSLPLMLQYQYTSSRDSTETEAVLFTAGIFF